MLSKIISRRGETMIEVLVALTILVLGIAGGLYLLGLAGKQNQITREHVVATNLAREGIEAVRNVRDTNWLRFAGERRKCWNNNEVGVCDGDHPIEHQQAYIAEFDEADFRWNLSPVSDRLDMSNGTAAADFRLKQDPATGLYNHSGSGEESNYFREIFIEYVDDDAQNIATSSRPGSSCSTVENCANAMRVTSRVEWEGAGGTKDVTLTTILTDFLGRKEHN